jgi:RNA 3'-phosphate cyclase
MIEIDGSGGGGQILRTALAMSALTKKPFHMINIRGARPKPGLKAQHLTAVKIVAAICNADVKGAEMGSQEITFIPKQIKSGRFKFDIGTAGSTALAAQSLVPAALHAPDLVSIEIRGGTENIWAPTTTFFKEVFCYYLRMFGIDIKAETKKYGFYPKGGGVFEVKIKPAKKIKPLTLLKRGAFKKVDIWNISSDFLKERKVLERQLKGFKKGLGPDYEIGEHNKLYIEALNPGTSIHAHAHFENCKLSATIIGEKGKLAEIVGEECGKELLRELKSKAAIDKRTADQLMIYMALAAADGQGTSKIRTSEITNHHRTNSRTIELFLPVKFKISDKEKIIEVSKV